ASIRQDKTAFKIRHHTTIRYFNLTTELVGFPSFNQAWSADIYSWRLHRSEINGAFSHSPGITILSRRHWSPSPHFKSYSIRGIPLQGQICPLFNKGFTAIC